MTSFKHSAERFEDWLRAALAPYFDEKALAKKHDRMRSGAFPFLRATYWRWAETILDLCPGLRGAPAILSIGDVHLENFGTWRDAEGRLIWGANDFDDAAVMPYPLDLVRLAASALLAGKSGPPARAVCEAIWRGYRAGLAAPAPIVLERDYRWLREAVLLPEAERAEFWFKYGGRGEPVPKPYLDALRRAMPDPAAPIAGFAHTAGTGSLGKPRFVGQTEWRGGPVLREAKAILPSAWTRAHGGGDRILAEAIAGGACRAPDPHYHVAGSIVVRRLSPNSRKLESDDPAGPLLAREMLELMGREIANCHAGDASRLPAVAADAAARDADWLRHAAKDAADAVAREQKDYA